MSAWQDEQLEAQRRRAPKRRWLIDHADVNLARSYQHEEEIATRKALANCEKQLEKLLDGRVH